MTVVSMREQRVQLCIDAFYKKHGPCCAGCDWWRWHNAVVGDCTRSAPVAGAERIALLGFTWTSMAPKAGHVMTLREHVCGEFKDEPQGEKNNG